MTAFRLSVACVLAAAAARAEPPDPVGLADLTAANRASIGIAAGKGDASPIGTSDGRWDISARTALVGGSVRVRDDLEVVARIALRHEFLQGRGEGLPIEPHEDQLGAVRAGVRYFAAAGPIALSPAAWAWIPTAGGHDSVAWSYLDGTADPRTFLASGALGGSVAAAWRPACAYVAVEAGAAVVRDGLDNVFAMAGAGGVVAGDLSLHARVRVDAFPTRTLIAPAVAASLRAASRWQFALSLFPSYGDVHGIAALTELTWEQR